MWIGGVYPGQAYPGGGIAVTAARLGATATITLAAAGTLTSLPPGLSAGATLSLAAHAALTAPVALTASATVQVSASATLAPPALVGSATVHVSARATLTTGLRTSVRIVLAGEDITARVRKAGVTIRDVINDAPNTAQFDVMAPTPPAGGQAIRITLDDGTLLFSGQVQAAARSYLIGRPANQVWPTQAIDDTARANRRRPFGTWVEDSATDIASDLAAQCVPEFNTAIAPGLPAVARFTCDGTETLIAALVRLANLIGGYAKVEDETIALFIEDPGAAPDPVDPAHPPLNDPPVRVTVDSSQLRTRVYGKGYGEAVPTDVAAGETLLPLTNGASFTAEGGQAITGTTADGAQHQVIDYDSVYRSGRGTLVGTGVAPSGPPTAQLAAGSGVTSGLHSLTVVWVTSAGKTRPSPPTTIMVGPMDPPAAPTANLPQAGAGPDDGVHLFALSHVTATGETLPSATVAQTTSSTPLAPPLTPTAAVHTFEVNNVWAAGDRIYYQVTYRNASGETTAGGSTATITITVSPNGMRYAGLLTNLATPPAGVTARRIYRNRNGVWEGYLQTAALTDTFYVDNAIPATAGMPPSVNTALLPTRQVLLSGLEVSPPIGTARKIWGTVAGGTQLKLITTINRTDTSYLVTTPDASLGANAPTVGTSTGNQIALTNIQLGPSGVTSREIYMSLAGNTLPRRRALTLSNNSATTGTITIDDAALGSQTPEPGGDTSGLTQPTGQVNPGADTLPLADVSVVRPGGGWVVLGGQAVRYTTIVGQTVQGIPPAGPGAITTAVPYGQQALVAPLLVGVTGLDQALARGSLVHIWVQRDDLAAQAEQAARDGSDGIIEYTLTDSRRAEPSLTERCDAELALFARPIVTATYATRDPKTKSGKTVLINLPSPAINETLVIQDVTITEIDIAPHLYPRFSVTASSVRFSLEDTVRRLVAAGAQLERL